MVPSGEVVTHQLSRVDCSCVCSTGFFPGQGQFPHSRQPDCCVVYKPHGGNSITLVERPCNSAMGMVPGEGNGLIGRVSTRHGKLCSRFRVQNNTVFSGVATPQEHLSNPDEGGSPVRCRPICHSSEPPTAPICQLETRSLCLGDRCYEDTIDRMERLCLPTIRP